MRFSALSLEELSSINFFPVFKVSSLWSFQSFHVPSFHVPVISCSSHVMFQSFHVPVISCSNHFMFQSFQWHVPVISCFSHFNDMFQSFHVPVISCSSHFMFQSFHFISIDFILQQLHFLLISFSTFFFTTSDSIHLCHTRPLIKATRVRMTLNAHFPILKTQQYISFSSK